MVEEAGPSFPRKQVKIEWITPVRTKKGTVAQHGYQKKMQIELGKNAFQVMKV